MASRPSSRWAPDKDLIFEIMKQRKGRPAYARVYSAGQGLVYCTPLATCATGANTRPIVGGYGGIYPGISHPVDNAADAVKEVDAQADKGADFIKLWVDDELGTLPKMPVDVRKAIIDEAHKRGLRAIAHVFYLEDAKNLVSLGIDGFAHMVRDKPADDELIAAMKAKGTWQMVGTLSREASMFAFGERAPFPRRPVSSATPCRPRRWSCWKAPSARRPSPAARTIRTTCASTPMRCRASSGWWIPA